MIDIAARCRRGDFLLQVEETVATGGITAVFGRSGSGKSTLLRMLAGLERARGRIRIDGQVWLDSAAGIDLPTHRRAVGMVFQDGRLFPHLDVAGNLAFATRRAGNGGSGSDGGPATDEVVAALALSPLLTRAVTGLSGGERQRVALARSLLCGARLLLLDEPLSALDVAARREVLPLIKTVADQFGIAMIHVTHAVEEVVRLAERVLVLEAGRVIDRGAPRPVLERLGAEGLEEPLTSGTLVEARAVRRDPSLGLLELELAGQRLSLLLDTAPHADLSARPLAEPMRLWIRDRDVAIAIERPQGISIRNILEARIRAVRGDGQAADVLVDLAIGEQSLVARITRASAQELGLQPGQTVFALVKSVTLSH